MKRQGEMKRAARRGAVLVWLALMLVVLLGMVGLVIDAGMLMAAHRQAQNAADAAALAAGMDVMLGKSTAQATATAATFVQNYNGLSGAPAPVVHIPPTLGPYAGMPKYVEVIVSNPVHTFLIQVLPGVSSVQTVRARAVAGVEPVSLDAGVMSLDGTANPAVRMVGNGLLDVIGGRMLVNSNGSTALQGKGNGTVVADEIDVVGGATGTFDNLHTGVSPTPDPFGFLPTPTTSNGVINLSRAANSATGSYLPGIYPSGIKYTGTGAVTLAPGIYVLPGGGAGMDFGRATSVTGSGVMFYVTGANYNPVTGGPDNTDPSDPFNMSPPTNPGTTFATVNLDSSMNFTPIDTGTYVYGTPGIDTFNGMLVYYRRANTSGFDLTGIATTNNLPGTFYAKWGTLTLHGNGTFGIQFVVDKLNFTGNGTTTINYTGNHIGKAPQVFLVE